MSAIKSEHGRLKRAIAGAAPELARALGGPLAGAAARAVARAVLGRDAQPDDAFEAAIETASPEQLAALAAAEADFRLGMEAAAIDRERVAAGDRADARVRQVSLKDATPTVMGGLIIVGFFVILAAMLDRRLPEGAETEFAIMLGALATMTAAVVNYYFGSSAGSREKTRLLSKDARTPDL